MPATILAATPHTAFGELLRISLEDSGRYQVRMVQSSKEVRTAVKQGSFHLAILDATLGDEPFVPLCMFVLEQQRGVRLVVIPPDNNPNHPALGGLMPHGYLSRPFYLPDLIETVSHLLADRDKQFQTLSQTVEETTSAAPLPVPLPPWLQDPRLLHSYLGKELANTQAVAAIAGAIASPIAGSNGALPGSQEAAKGILQANTGILSDQAAQELIEIVFRYWNRSEKTDLMRFVRLSTSKIDYLVYATQITGEMVLILVYDTSVPLSQIRPQTKAMAQTLANVPSERPTTERNASSIPATSEPETQPLDDDQVLEAAKNVPLPSNSQPSPPNTGDRTTTESSIDDVVPQGEQTFAAESGEEDSDNQDRGVINLTALLGSVPAPDPEDSSRNDKHYGAGWFLDRTGSSPIPTLSGGMRDQQPAGNEASTEGSKEDGSASQPADQRRKKRNIRTAPLDPQTIPRDSLPASPSLPVDYALPAARPSKAAENDSPEDTNDSRAATGRPASMEVKTELPVLPPGVPAPAAPRHTGEKADLAPGSIPLDSSLEETHPHILSTVSSLDQLEYASPALSLLNYTCVLVPRLPQHYLTGELADRLAGWVQQLCLAFGWRLEGISIRPEYLQWTVQVAPAISPGNLVKIIRQRTSQHIFSSYAYLAELNPSGDFWATGYLIVSGAQPPSAQLLRDYIAQTRKRQGISK